MKALVLVAGFFLGSSNLVASEPGTDPVFRADDGNLWHVRDNPGILGLVPDYFALGISYSPTEASGELIPNDQFLSQLGSIDIEEVSPFLNLGLSYRGSDILYRVGTAIRFARWLSIGYSDSWWQSDPNASVNTFGAIIRPFDFLSLGLTAENSFSPDRRLGIGLGFRPLAFFEGLGKVLTLSTDAHVDSEGLSFENIAIHADIAGRVGLRAWYDFTRSWPGIELSARLGPSESRVSLPELSQPLNLRVSTALRISPANTGIPGIGKRVLVLRDLPPLKSAPVPPMSFESLFLPPGPRDLPSLVALLDRAASDPSVEAVAFENPPVVGDFESAQTLAAAFERLKAHRKKIWIQADDLADSTLYLFALSKADRISLSPSGSLLLRGPRSERLYLKDFFDKLGLRFLNLAPWETKSAYNNFTDNSMPEGERGELTRLLSGLADQGMASLAQSRTLAKSPKELLDAGPYLIAKDALSEGLVDDTSYRADFEAWMKKQIPGVSLVDELPAAPVDSWGPSLVSKKVAVVYLSGDIVLGKGIAGQSIGTSALDEIIRLREDPEIKAIILRVDSPGGAASISDEIAVEVKKTVASGKPVVVSMGDYAASGGYLVSAYASRIIAAPATISGSIGVTGLVPNFAGTLDKLGIHPDSVDTQDSSGFLDVLKPFRDQDVQKLKASILDTYARFVQAVAEGRKISEDKVRSLAEGRVWTGKEALDLGLVDQLGDLEAAKDYVRKALGGWVEFFDDAPGAHDLGGLGLFASKALSKVLGVDVTVDPTQGLAARLEALFGPEIDSALGILDMGQGALLYFDSGNLGG